MEKVTESLQQYASVLANSFGRVSEKVEKSMEQSTQVMHTMNSVMENAVLQNVRIHVKYSNEQQTITAFIHNNSPIRICEATFAVQARYERDAEGSGSVTAQKYLSVLESGDSESVVLDVPPNADLATENILVYTRLTMISPGTRQPIEKKAMFQISFLEHLQFTGLKNELSAALRKNKMWESRPLRVDAVRQILRLSAFDPLLTDEQGYYNATWSHALSVSADRNMYLAFVRTVDQAVGLESATLLIYGDADAGSAKDEMEYAESLVSEFERVAAIKNQST